MVVGRGTPGNLATLFVDFHSEFPQGTLIVRVDGNNIVNESFKSGGRSFLRRRTGSVSFRRPAPPLSPGVHEFQVHVTPEGGKGVVKSLSETIQSGSTNILNVRLSASGQAVALELHPSQ